MLHAQDGITAFEALESGILAPLRELLAWLEMAAANAAACRSRPRRLVTAETKVAIDLEREAVDALAIVPVSDKESNANVSQAGLRTASSEAVLQVGNPTMSAVA